MSSAAHDLSVFYRNGDRLSVAIIWLIALISLGLSSWYDTWTAWFLAGLPATVIPTLLWRTMPGARLTRISVALSYMAFAALTIHQAHGMVEFHFAIFVLLAFLLVYRDWLPIVVAAGAIAVHHVVFNHLQVSDAGVYIFSETGHGIVLLHAAYVVFEAVILVYLAQVSHREALLSVELDRLVREIRPASGVVNLRYRFPSPQSALAGGLHDALDALQQTLTQVRNAFTQLDGMANRLRSDSEETSNQAGAQFARTNDLAAATNEMTTSIHHVAGNAGEMANTTEQTAELLNGVQQAVEKATTVIRQVETRLQGSSDQVHRLEQQSQNIGMVLGVIRTVAERTNLLALNAAIEAARAGEHGRGFAVVADEVRNLARQTQESTGEIEDLIRQLQEQTSESAATMREGVEETSRGASEMSSAAQALGDAMEAIGRLAQASAEIASSAEEQSQVSEEINRRLTDINDSSSGNQQRSEKAKLDANNLIDMVEDMRAELKRFQI